MKTAVFGGSFNPVHIGHLIVAEAARAAFALDRVLFMPANISPHKSAADGCMLAGNARAELLRAATQDNPHFEVSARELERGGVSYTIDTLSALGAREDAPLYCILGADLAPALASWHRAPELARLARFIAAPRRIRSGAGARDGQRPAAPPPFSLEYFDCPEIGVSSSMIRERLASGRSARYLVPDAAYAIIRARGYYAAGAGV